VSGDWDASIRNVQAVESAVVFAPLDVVPIGSAFDVVAAVRVGASLMSVADSYDLFVVARSLSRGSVLARTRDHHLLRPQRHALHRTLRTSVPAGWDADDGDLLDVIATFKVTAGVHTDYSHARSDPFIAGS
jgi:hypothetical protein